LVLGPALVRYRDANGIQDVEITKGTLYRFTFPPKVAHAFGALGPEPMFLVGFNTEIYDSEHPDAIPDHILGADDIAKFI
jgi:dTDP-4-dehydrorhamnose 3,5-epimerase-like enzyme